MGPRVRRCLLRAKRRPVSSFFMRARWSWCSRRGRGEPKPLRVVNPGRILGLSSVVMQRPHDCSAIARTECEVGFVGREEFLRSLEKTPAIWLSVLRMLSSDVNSVYDDMRVLAIG
ncbi:MAG TPA: cyclic nucleotide-binding domain-containing protein [Thermoanaerobaculia bacterium]|nr:cyclic nucleotide-binding domain-containing protein [Thermoanaerobaculia bacterium]